MDEQEEIMDKALEFFLEHTVFTQREAILIAIEIHETLEAEFKEHGSPLQLCRRVIQLGAEAYRQECQTVSFRDAVEQSLQSRSERRQRTLAELRQCCRRVLRNHPELADKPIRSISPEYCHRIIHGVYQTPTSRRKARRLLHSIFAFALRHGWCSSNPLAAVDLPPVRESPIEALNIREVRRLLDTACRPEHLPCAPAVGLMLWAGIRPTELTRLHWSDVQFADRVVTIAARHSKTGGARQVTLHPRLIRWLRETAPYRLPGAFIIPRAWIRRWRDLRLAAGFPNWHADTLRHTFASYHLKRFNDLGKLQLEMGHADSSLLRTRYLDMKGITMEHACEFWGESRTGSRSASRKGKT